MKDQMKEYRSTYALQDYEKAEKLLEGSELKDDKKSSLLWCMEKGTLSLAQQNLDAAISHFQAALELIDRLYTKKLSAKAATLFINDASDVFYGANYERSYAHYFLAKSLYFRFLKTGNKLDLQGARGTILAWDTYFTELQRSLPSKTLYQTDLMMKVFGGEVHEVSEIRNDKQIALQLYKDALQILYTQGGVFSIFNQKSTDYIKFFESEGKIPPAKFYEATSARDDLKDFLHFKILSLTKEIRGGEFEQTAKSLSVRPETKKRASQGTGNVVLVLEEGLIPQKIGKPFNFGIKGAMNAVGDSKTKQVIATVGVEVLTAFAMNKLGMVPSRTAPPGSFIFAHDVTKLAVQEAAIEFELPMIENVPLVQRLEVFILNDKGVVIQHGPLPVVSENGDIARVVLEEQIVSHYTKTGMRVAIKHIAAITTAILVYNSLNSRGDFLAKTAAMATYIGASKGIAAMEKADTRHWTTLPQALRMYETKLPAGNYKIAIANYSGDVAPEAPAKILGNINVKESGKLIFTLSFNP
jgi:tetratricopeptide (TPR) repeat protein